MSRTKVRFIEGGTGELLVCELEASFQHPLSRDLQAHLDSLNLALVHREARLSGARLLQRVHIAGAKGEPLGETQRLELQTLLLTLATTGPSSPGATPGL